MVWASSVAQAAADPVGGKCLQWQEIYGSKGQRLKQQYDELQGRWAAGVIGLFGIKP